VSRRAFYCRIVCICKSVSYDPDLQEGAGATFRQPPPVASILAGEHDNLVADIEFYRGEREIGEGDVLPVDRVVEPVLAGERGFGVRHGQRPDLKQFSGDETVAPLGDGDNIQQPVIPTAIRPLVLARGLVGGARPKNTLYQRPFQRAAGISTALVGHRFRAVRVSNRPHQGMAVIAFRAGVAGQFFMG
jgi:hypothetical protein